MLDDFLTSERTEMRPARSVVRGLRALRVILARRVCRAHLAPKGDTGAVPTFSIDERGHLIAMYA